MTIISREAVTAERLRRQGLAKPVETAGEYAALFRLLQPVLPIWNSCPGEPPSLVHRTVFNDREVAFGWRGEREIVKGRFLGGTIGYVFSDELELYGDAFQRPLAKPSLMQQQILETLEHVGPLTPWQIKSETGLLNKEIMSMLHRLQQAFLVYEDQVDSDWERAWYLFAQEWPEVVVKPERWETAAREVLGRFIGSHVFVTAGQVKDWSGWGAKEVKKLLGVMEAAGEIVCCIIEGLSEGWMRAEDEKLKGGTPAPSVFMLHKADPLVRSHASELKERFKDVEVLQYLLIDGDFRGAVLGHWRIGPHDVDDIVVELPAKERAARREEIVGAVAWGYHPPKNRIRRYAGVEI